MNRLAYQPLSCRQDRPEGLVPPFLKTGKNDFKDTEAIAEAVTRPTTRFDPVEKAEQPDLQALRRGRDRFVYDRTAAVNQIRAFLMENDIPIPSGRTYLKRELPDVLEDADNRVSDAIAYAASPLLATLGDAGTTNLRRSAQSSSSSPTPATTVAGS